MFILLLFTLTCFLHKLSHYKCFMFIKITKNVYHCTCTNHTTMFIVITQIVYPCTIHTVMFITITQNVCFCAHYSWETIVKWCNNTEIFEPSVRDLFTYETFTLLSVLSWLVTRLGYWWFNSYLKNNYETLWLLWQ